MYTTTDITEHPNPVTNKHAVFSHHRQTFCRLSALFIGGIYTLLLYGGLTAGSGTLLFSVSQFVVEVTEWIFSHTCVFLSVSITERTKCLFTLHMQWDGYLHEFGSKTTSSYNKRGLLFYHCMFTLSQMWQRFSLADHEVLWVHVLFKMFHAYRVQKLSHCIVQPAFWFRETDELLMHKQIKWLVTVKGAEMPDPLSLGSCGKVGLFTFPPGMKTRSESKEEEKHWQPLWLTAWGRSICQFLRDSLAQWTFRK